MLTNCWSENINVGDHWEDNGIVKEKILEFIAGKVGGTPFMWQKKNRKWFKSLAVPEIKMG
jgi:hypothetical protein